jgi:hypothetical protein
MAKWSVQAEFSGYSRGVATAIVEAETEDDAKQIARGEDCDFGPIEIVRDDREVDLDWLTVEPYEPATPATKFWLLERPADSYDVQAGCVVEAADEAAARLRAAFTAGDEGASAWLDTERTSCKEVQLTGDTRTVLRSYHAG